MKKIFQLLFGVLQEKTINILQIINKMISIILSKVLFLRNIQGTILIKNLILLCNKKKPLLQEAFFVISVYS